MSRVKQKSVTFEKKLNFLPTIMQNIHHCQDNLIYQSKLQLLINKFLNMDKVFSDILLL